MGLHEAVIVLCSAQRYATAIDRGRNAGRQGLMFTEKQ